MRRWVTTILLISILSLAACVPPMRLPKRIEGADTTKIPEIGEIRPGVTTREEVLRDYKSIDTGVSPGMFWGRYIKSTWSNPGAYRSWGRENLLVESDGKGIVTRVRKEDDSKMNALLVGWLNKQANAAAKTPARLQCVLYSYANSKKAEMTLQADKLEIVAEGGARLSLVPSKLRRMRTYDLYEYSEIKNRWMEEELIVEGERPVQLQLSPADVVALLDYVMTHAPGVKFE